MFLQQGPKLFFECHLAMMNFLARNGRDNRLAHLAPFQGVRLIGSSRGVESRSGAAAFAPFPDPAHQTGRAVFPHPAFGQGLGSFRPRQVSAEAFQSEQTELLVEVLIPEAITV